MTIQLTPAAAVVGVGVLVLGFVAWKGAGAVAAVTDTAAGILTGNNALTQNATNGTGERVTAYQDAGIVGTLGAGANAISGGWFATLGENVGGWMYEAFNDPPVINPPANTGGATGYW